MKTIKIIALFAAVMSVSALATTVSGVTATQHWPWDGKVDISYTLTATSQKTTPVFAVSFQGKIGDGEAFNLSYLEGDGSAGITLGAGSKRVVWDSGSQRQTKNGVKTDSLQVAVTAQDVTDEATYLYVDLSSYKVNYSSTPPTMDDTIPGKFCKFTQLWFRRIENGTFTMGSDSSEFGRDNDGREEAHSVTITKAFYIGIFEFTSGQYNAIRNGSASTSYTPYSSKYTDMRGNSYGITWPSQTDHRVDSTSILGMLRAKTGNGLIFDLPTEAQWELACRDKGDGTYYGSGYLNNGTHFSNEGDLISGLMSVAWFTSTAEVGTKTPSTIGLYDMHGNVAEMCLDWYGIKLPPSAEVDPVGPVAGEERVLKGGHSDSHRSNHNDCRIASRELTAPEDQYRDQGCRLVLVP